MPSNPAKAPARAKPGNKRVTGKEQYYTPAKLAQQLLAEVLKAVPDLATRTVIEPAGGTGSFIEAAREFGVANFVSVDIEPKHEAVRKADFLEFPIKVKDAITISNPPFGRNNSLSIPFFNKAADHSEYICFIVPRSWRKWSVINRLDKRFHLVADHDIQIDYEDASGKKLSERNDLRTCFQIWQRKAENRGPIKVQDLSVVSKTTAQEADVALTVFGFGCGTLRTEFERKPNSTRMFLKLQHPDALQALQTVDYARFFRNTAYTEALSLQEINYLLNEQIFGNPHLVEQS
jgi:predicted RNA methylase